MAKQVALNCALLEQQGNEIRLGLIPAHAQMLTKTVQERIRQALEQYFDAPVNLRFQIGELAVATPEDERKHWQAEQGRAAVAEIHQDPNVRALMDTFGAQITGIHPLDDEKA